MNPRVKHFTYVNASVYSAIFALQISRKSENKQRRLCARKNESEIEHSKYFSDERNDADGH